MADPCDWREVHEFWFPATLADADHPALVRMAEWWMKGGATPELPRFRPTVEAARAGWLGHWCEAPAGRLSLIIVLDQFTRGLFAGTPEAYSSDPDALHLVEEGLRNGAYDALPSLLEKAFFLLPLAHAEGPGHLERLDRAVAEAETWLAAAPDRQRRIFEFGLGQSRGHRDVIARFGRFPHRNAVLGRPCTEAEAAYVAAGEFVHTRRLPAAP